MKVFKVEKGKLYIGEVDDKRTSVGNCYVCGLPVLTSSGQLYKLKGGKPSHKKCR